VLDWLFRLCGYEPPRKLPRAKLFGRRFKPQPQTASPVRRRDFRICQEHCKQLKTHDDGWHYRCLLCEFFKKPEGVSDAQFELGPLPEGCPYVAEHVFSIQDD